MKRIATILLTLGALSACGGMAPDISGEEGRQTAPLWMVERDLQGCDASVIGDTLLRHPFDAALVVAVGNGVPTCIDTVDGAKAVKASKWQPPAGQMMSAVEPPNDDPVPIREEEGGEGEQEGEDEEGEEEEGGEDPGLGQDTLTIPNLGETISDDPVPILEVGGDAVQLLKQNDADGDSEK